MGKKFVIEKLMSGLVEIFAAVVMLFSIMFALVRETTWPFLIVTALTCPLWHWLLRKYILKEKLLALWLIKGSAIVAGCVLLAGFAGRFPYYSCEDIMIEDRVSTLYEENMKTDTTEFLEVTGIEKNLVADYYKVKAVANYKDTKSGEKKSEEVTLYFDRFSGQYFANFDNMRKYRQQSWKYEEGVDMCMFEQDRVNEIVKKWSQALLAADRKAMEKLMNDALKNTITQKQWQQWQSLVVSKGKYVSILEEPSLSFDYETLEGKRIGQLLHISWTIKLTKGEVRIQSVLGEELRFREVTIS